MKNSLKQFVFIALFSLGIAMLSLNLTSCEEGGIDSQPATGLKVGIGAQTTYALTATAPSEIRFTVTANTPWTISSSESWCVPTPVSSTVSALIQEITVITDPNPEAKPRTAILTIQGEGVEDQIVTINQESMADIEIAMFETAELFARNGGTREFTIKSNKSWTLASDKSWLTFDKSSGEGTGEVEQVVATVAENSGNLRRATISVNIQGETTARIYEISQDGNLLEVVNIADSIFGSGKEAKVYQLNANINWVAEPMPGSEWIHISPVTSGEGNAELTIEAEANPIFVQRRGQVRIKPATAIVGLEDQIIQVVQPASCWADIADATVTYTEEGGVVITSENNTSGKKARMVTNQVNRLGIYTWKFGVIDIPEGSNAYFDINGWPDVSPTTANYHIFLKNTNPTFSIGGGFNWDWANNRIDMGDRKLNDMKTLTLKLERDEEQAGKMTFRLYFNDELILERKNLTNVYEDPREIGLPIYFGMFDGAGTMTIESFTVTPID